MQINKENEKEQAAIEAVKAVRDGMVVGLGTGSTAFYAIQAVGKRVHEGLQIRCVTTSSATGKLALSLGIPLISIDNVEAIDITIDGADEFTTSLELIKGGGGALLKEKVVASLSKEEIIIADSSKLVQRLGRFTVPVEVTPYAVNYVLSVMKNINGRGKIRLDGTNPHVTEEGNYIIDTDFGLIADPKALARSLDGITGVVEHGLFINLATKVIMGKGEKTLVYLK